jgi:hypothetical protein
MNFFWRELFDPDEPESYGRRVQALLFELVVVARAQYELWMWTKIIPLQSGIPKPAGIARVVDVSFMIDGFAASANAALAGVFMLLGLAQRLRWGYLLGFCAFHLQYVARFGLGKVQHSTNMLGFALLALAAAHLSYRDPVLRRKAAHGLTVLLFSFGYSLAAIAKLRAKGLRWADGHHLWLWVSEKRIDVIAASGRSQVNFLQKLVSKNLHVATLMLAGGLAAEMSSALMWWRRVRRWIMLALAAMHLGIAQVMNIHFVPNVLILLALGLPIAELIDLVRARRVSRVDVATTGANT